MNVMRFYDGQHGFYAGIDLHARTLHLCVLDAKGKVVKDANIAATPDPFLQAIAPYRADLVVGCECMFAWYSLSDLCLAEKVPLLVGHALYMKLIHAALAKNDRIDANKIARLLKGGNFPLSYVYPKGMRETRDLLRRRSFLVRQRAGLMTHLQILNAQYNLPPLPKKLPYAANRAEMDVAGRFADPSVRKSAACDLAVIDCLDGQIAELELYLTRAAKVDDVHTYHRLRTIPGVGPVLALILLYEIHDVGRFPGVGQFLSYARLVRCSHESDGKVVGTGGEKIGNGHLRWAFGEAACLFLRGGERAKRWKERQAKKRGEGKALAVLAARLGRAVYHLWRKAEAFDEDRFWAGRPGAGKARRVPLVCSIQLPHHALPKDNLC
jgi:transposase